jgi:hypothetical protein
MIGGAFVRKTIECTDGPVETVPPATERASIVDVDHAGSGAFSEYTELRVERYDHTAWRRIGDATVRASSVIVEHAGIDRNGDGIAELVVVDGNDGNCWSCSRVRLFQLRDGALVDILDVPSLGRSHWPAALSDIDDDGVEEVIVHDISWEDEIISLCHACAPRPAAVLRFEAGQIMIDDHTLRQAQILEAEQRRRSGLTADNALGVLSATLTLTLVERGMDPIGPHGDISLEPQRARAMFFLRLGGLVTRLNPRDLNRIEQRLWPSQRLASPKSNR